MNFAKLIKELNDAGWTQTDIAAWTGCTQGNISAILRTNREPRYTLGCRIVGLHDIEVRNNPHTPRARASKAVLGDTDGVY